MSVQFGRWNLDGEPVDPGYLEKVNSLIAAYGPDRSGFYNEDGILILHHALHTTKESRRETQPYRSPCGAILTWDGRLDNREALLREFGETLTTRSTDLEIVAAAYQRWQTGCFARLAGDWALAIWHSRDRSLILAKDFAGTRPLFYSFGKDQVVWSTILDPQVFPTGKPFALCEEYLAGWLSFFPATHLTPYAGICSVPPSSYILFAPERHVIRKYWDFVPARTIHYRTDGEYEEHFRTVLREAIRRRLRSDRPILAELSGGCDSSSVVCLADNILACGAAETERLDTVSYYDDSEPNWNERPYFSMVEQRRGRTGCHIDVGSSNSLPFEIDGTSDDVVSGRIRRGDAPQQRFATCMISQQNRVLISGVGGDEFLGGVPTPLPELTDLFRTGRVAKLGRQLIVWALANRKTILGLLGEMVGAFLPSRFGRRPGQARHTVWLKPAFLKRQHRALGGYEARLKLFGPLPSFQENMHVLDMIRRQLACSRASRDPAYETRYPYLDRDLLEFLFHVPREQLVRPGQRRSLMRRALTGIVPNDILNRRRKAFVVRTPLRHLSAAWPKLMEMTENLMTDAMGIVDRQAFSDALEKARHGQEIHLVALMRTLALEGWLRGLRERNLIHISWSACQPTHQPATKASVEAT